MIKARIKQFYTVKQVCGKLQISRPTLYRYIKQGLIKRTKIGGSVRFIEDEVIRLIDAGQPQSSPTPTTI